MAQPKTATERRFVEYANSLPPIDPEKVEWGYRNLLPSTAYYWRHRGNKAEMWCQCCGHSQEVELCFSLMETWTCPHCGKDCKVKNKKMGFAPIVEGRVMSVFEVYNGVQVVRTIEVMRDNTERGRTELYYRERYQNWILDKGQEVITCQPYTRSFSGGIIVAALPTVKSVYDEGEAMHHCIYSNGYYKRTDTLLLSARDKETGRRIESIEVSLNSFKVMQSRGKYNKDTDQHDKILRIMRRNMAQIRAIRQQAV